MSLVSRNRVSFVKHSYTYKWRYVGGEKEPHATGWESRFSIGRDVSEQIHVPITRGIFVSSKGPDQVSQISLDHDEPVVTLQVRSEGNRGRTYPSLSFSIDVLGTCTPPLHPSRLSDTPLSRRLQPGGHFHPDPPPHR